MSVVDGVKSRSVEYQQATLLLSGTSLILVI